MLLARAGLRVLAVDRARFPSDTLSSHQIQLPGVARLRRWGLLDRLHATGAPPSRRVRFDPGGIVLDGEFLAHDGVDALYSPRRAVLDHLLVDAARGAGADVREGFAVEEILATDGRVTGIRGRERGGAAVAVTETADMVIGADGKNSTVSVAVGAARYRVRPDLALACYTYWSGLPLDGGELYQRPGRAVAVFPTNDALSMVYVAAPLRELDAFRRDSQVAYMATLDDCGDLGERVRAGTRAERFRIAPEQPNFFAKPYGPGWALVGDAGLALDSITAHGISNALRDAEFLTDAIVAARDGGRPLGADLRAYQRRRDTAGRPMYDFTTQLASFRARSAAETALFRALDGRPAEISRFLGVFAGTEPMSQYFGVRNAVRLIGLPTVARVAWKRGR
jgi:2-polyprenyl-6-methoxyphenol hydroxylase-like FAD-dependent oxidoreductase